MNQPGHFVAIIGGAVAGSEAAQKLAERGIYSAVFEQNALPYGKLETGLPKWHINLRNSQEAKIDKKLSHPLVTYVPSIKIGQDLDFDDIAYNWGFSAILLATGAWRDRPLPITGIDNYINKGFYYQNPFVAWYNLSHDPNYQGMSYQIYDRTIVIGGGLASLDVMKILSIETARQALKERGHDVDSLKFEKRGVFDVLADYGLTVGDLNLEGCTLFYRKRLIDMPLNSLPEDRDPDKTEKAIQVRQKIMDNFLKKYFFKFQECYTPLNKIVYKDQLAGIEFQKTEIVDGHLVHVENSNHEVRGPVVISAIGSLPEPITGIPFNGGVFKIKDTDSGQLEGYDHVFVLGNAVTGRGNIKESQSDGRRVSEKIMDEFLAWHEEDYQEIFNRAINNADEKIESIESKLRDKKVLSKQKIETLMERIDTLHRKVNYHGDYDAWINHHLPTRLEKTLQMKIE
jgi:NADPH-dependent glutamate synthase beta subunit-like oxidoreductase